MTTVYVFFVLLKSYTGNLSTVKNKKDLKTIGKEGINLLLFIDNVYIENSRKPTKKKITELVSEFSKEEINIMLILKFIYK